MSENTAATATVTTAATAEGLAAADRMKLFWVLFKNELRKLAAKKKYIVFFIIGVSICLINVGFRALVNLLASGGELENIFKFGSLSTGVFGFFIEIFIPFIAFLAATDLIGGEYQSGSIKAVLMRPVSRTKIYFSKIMAIFTMCVINMFGIYIFTVILDAAVGNLTASGFVYSLSIYIIDIVPIFLIVLLATFINATFKSSGISMLICIVVYAGLKIGGVFIPSMSGLLFTGYIQWHSLWLGTALPFTVMFSKIALILGYAIVLASAGYYIFLKTDF